MLLPRSERNTSLIPIDDTHGSVRSLAWGRLTLTIAAILLGTALSAPVLTEEEVDPLDAVFPDGRHLLTLNYSRIDAFDADSDLWIPSYSFAYNRRFRFTAQVPYLKVSRKVSDSLDAGDADSASGFGDVSVLIQYDPGANLSANAFVPTTLGLTLGLQLPTGDFREGLGQDAWVATLGGGWLVDFFKDSWLVPAVSYTQSFDEGSKEFEVQRADFEVGAFWLFRSAVWLGIEPNAGYDFVLDDWRLDLAAVLGKAWHNGMALELSWARLDRIDAFAQRDDQQLFLTLSYQFGRPPR